jgi:hypothetical protein
VDSAITRAMVVRANTKTGGSRARLRSALNSLGLAGTKKAAKLHCCDLCACPILIGDDYRTAGKLRAHEWCFLAVNKEIR